MIFTFSLFCLFFSISVHGKDFLEDISAYFSSGARKDCVADWEKQDATVVKAIKRDIQEHSKTKIMNVFEKYKYPSSELLLTNGFISRDGVVTVLHRNLKLRNFPNLIGTILTLSVDVPGHYLYIKSFPEKFFIDGTYFLFRNEASVIDKNAEEFDQMSESPFTLSQVSQAGSITIIAENCRMVVDGIIEVTHDVVKLTNLNADLSICRLSVELSNPVMKGAPPVISSYYSKDYVKKLMGLTTHAMQGRLQSLIESSLLSYVNLSATFGDHLNLFRKEQKKIFETTYLSLDQFISSMNPKNVRPLSLPEFNEFGYKITDVQVYGLDTAYLSHNGGPYSDKATKSTLNELKFKSLLVKGSMEIKQAAFYKFFVEIRDLSVKFYFGKGNVKLIFGNMELSEVQWQSETGDDTNLQQINMLFDKMLGKQLIHGYLNDVLGDRVISTLNASFKGSANRDDELFK